MQRRLSPGLHGPQAPPEVEVLIEIPRGSFIKRGSTGHVDFVSPLPCPFNYGSVPQYVGLEGDLLDAVVLGPRLPLGTRTHVRAWGAERVLRFFHFYAKCKGVLNLLRRRPGRNACDGWCDAKAAIARARVRDASWQGPPIPF